MRCPNCGEENPERARFCGNCGFPLAEAVPSRPEERKVVTALFCDLADFTERSDLADPEDVKATLRPFHELLKREIERFGGTLDKFVGDAIMALWGAPIAHADDPDRALRAAVAMQRGIARLNQQWSSAGRPAGSISAMSAPEPLTHSAATSSPSRSRSVVFTEVLPPPCSTSLGSRPSRRVV